MEEGEQEEEGGRGVKEEEGEWRRGSGRRREDGE